MDTEPSEWSKASDIWLNPLPDIYHLLILIYQQSIVWHFIPKTKSKWKNENLQILENSGKLFAHVREPKGLLWPVWELFIH